jgi:membrane-associated phospholipid phosphatase
MPFLVLILLALTVACAVGALTWRYPRIAAPAPTPALGAARALGKTAGAHPSLRGVLVPRLDPEAATGLALTLALLFTVAGGVLLGLLAYLVRTNSHLIGFDNGVAKWGVRHASAFSTHGLNAVTQLASIYTVIGLCLVLAVTETLRTRSRWILPFLLAAVGGEELLTLTIKHLVNRVRPAFNPAAAALGPAFPSGHAATAAAFYATAALLLGRQRGHTARALLAGLAAGIAVAVAASRVLLDVHWLTDVIAGLALGWAWFAVCTIAFGGRLLRFGVAAEVAARVADVTESAEADGNRDRPREPSRAGA